MGIGVKELYLLSYSTNKKPLGNVLTIGRQEIHLEESKVVSTLKRMKNFKGYTHNKYAENILIKNFDALSVESIDNSNYENATHVYDLNFSIENNLKLKYDTIIDFGCTEHIYNISNALENLSLMCKAGGVILHILPANNMCGHGFWQFSPELFFSLYSDKNGYKNTEVLLVDDSNVDNWYNVKKPSNGERVNINSSSKSTLYVVCRTTKIDSNFNHKNIQQSDYIALWQDFSGNKVVKLGNNSIKNFVKKWKYLVIVLRPLNNVIRSILNNDNKLNSKNKNLIKINIVKILSNF
jgi:hypothetical protein